MVRIPRTIPAITDSTGNPGIPPPTTLDVTVIVEIFVVEVTETKVETDVAISVVDVEIVDATRDVEVEVTTVAADPPNGENLSIVESAFVEIVVKPGSDPTTQPLLDEVMYTELRTGGICPRSAGDVVI
jgi:hypothetical protein